MKKSTTLQLVLAALFTALGILLPAVFHPFGLAGSVFLPMHIPVLLCGFIVGSTYGALTGFIIPFLSNAFTVCAPIPYRDLALELCIWLLGISRAMYFLVGAITGRIVMGFANFVLLGLSGDSYIFSTFITAAFVTALPRIIIQLIYSGFTLCTKKPM